MLAFSVLAGGCWLDDNGDSSSSSSGSSSGSTGTVCAGADCVNLGTAGTYAIFANTGIATDAGASVITGNIGVGPGVTSTAITGFALNLPAASAFSTSAQVSGKVYAFDYAIPSPTDVDTASLDMGTAYTAANGMAPAGGGDPAAGGVACPGVGALGGLTITPGVYTCTVELSIATGTNVTLSGAGVYVIRTTQGISQASGTQVLLTNGALAQNVFWVPALTVNIVGIAGTTTTMAGVILAKTDIVVGTNATVNGRLLAQTAVTLDQATVTQP